MNEDRSAAFLRERIRQSSGWGPLPGAPFICIDPWHGIADPVGLTGDFTEKPGVFIRPPGAQRELRMQVTLTTG